MKRSAVISLKFATASKQLAIRSLRSEYDKAVNFYIDACWDKGGKFDAATLRQLVPPLSYRYKGQSLKQATGIVIGTKRAAKLKGRCVNKPCFTGGLDLSVNMLQISLTSNSFDGWIKLSTLEKGCPIWFPFRKTRVFNKWSARGRLIQGGSLFELHGQFYVRISFEVEQQPVPDGGPVVGVDRGVNVLLATSHGHLIGTTLDKYIERIKRTTPKSNGRQKALTARTQYVNECLKQLPLIAGVVLVIEALKGIKHGKKGKLSKSTNRRFSHWTIGKMGQRIQELCEEHAVQLHEVPAQYTSQCCPDCSHVEKGNRRGTVFKCRRCGYTQHADTVGALNIRDVYLGKILVPQTEDQIVKV